VTRISQLGGVGIVFVGTDDVGLEVRLTCVSSPAWCCVSVFGSLTRCPQHPGAPSLIKPLLIISFPLSACCGQADSNTATLACNALVK
jgi:hypothetical protein